MQAVLKPFFGAWIVQFGETVFPRLFTKKSEALALINYANRKNKGEGA